MDIMTIPVSRLVVNQGNPNRLSERKRKALRKAIQKGFKDPIEVCLLTKEFEEFNSLPKNDRKGWYLIVDGHHRVEEGSESTQGPGPASHTAGHRTHQARHRRARQIVALTRGTKKHPEGPAFP